MEATAAEWITAGFTVVLAAFTAALVVVTGRYVEQTRLLVGETRASREEMRADRLQRVRPHFAMEFERLGGTAATLSVSNLGEGAALDSELTISFIPLEAGDPDVRRWQPPVVASGHRQRFFPPAEGLDMEVLASGYGSVRLRGVTHDVLGERHDVLAEIPDIPGWWRRTKEARRHHMPDPLERATKELSAPLKTLNEELARLRVTLAQRQGEG